ncbi:MAG: hypothetical protein ACEPOZ_10535 [Marinifilaceae bacterium]
MIRKRTIVVCGKNDGSVHWLKERIDSQRLSVFLHGKECEFYTNGDFVFGWYQGTNGFDKEFQHEELGVSNEARILVDTIKRNVKWNEEDEIVLAVHWGGRSLKEYKELINQLNQRIDKNRQGNIQFSYWGSRSKTYRSGKQENIVGDIRSYLYGDESSLFGMLDVLRIQRKTLQLTRKQMNRENWQNFSEANGKVMEMMEQETVDLLNEIRYWKDRRYEDY